MQWWEAILLGVVQGLTEFLPVSSSGHLYLLQNWLSIDRQVSFSFLVFVHVGTLGAIIFYFWSDIKKITYSQFINLVIAMLPIVGVGILFESYLSNLDGVRWLSITFGITASLLFLSEALLRNGNSKTASWWRLVSSFRNWLTGKTTPSWMQALSIGFMQSIAILPGVSRSGSTLTGSILSGLPRQQAFTFSFLLGVPAIAAAVSFDSLKLYVSGEWLLVPWSMFLLGVISSFVTGWLALRILHWFWKQERLWPFALYCMFVSILLVLFA